MAFGIIFVAFSGLAALINYELDKTLYTSAAPVSLIEMSILTAMLPFVASAVLSFSVSGVISRTTESKDEKETQPETKSAQAETTS